MRLTDHKWIARGYFWAGLLFLGIGGSLALVMRWQWAYPGQPIPGASALHDGSAGAVTPASYTGLFTNHGVIMVFFAVTPLLIGCFSSFCIPLLIGARRMALRRLHAAGFGIFVAAQLAALASIALPAHPATSGWTFYPPLSTGSSTPGGGQTLMIVAVLLATLSSGLSALAYLTTVVTRRAPGMGWSRLPLTVWGLFITAALNALFAPVLLLGTVLLLCDRLLGSSLFAPMGGDPVIYQHLFWIFGHPEVYILILPVWGVIGDLVGWFSGRPAHWYRGSVYAMAAVAVLSGTVYGHHMFQAGIGPGLATAFEVLTLLISFPAMILFANWLLTLWPGGVRRTVPMLFVAGAMVVFGIGGLTGLFLGAITIDIYFHDTMWVVGHFHFVMAASTLLGTFAAIYYWFPKLFGRLTGELLGRIHFWGTLVSALITFGGMLAAGWAGQPRRVFDPSQYAFLDGIDTINKISTHGAFMLAGFQLVFLVNLLWSLRRGRVAPNDPWQAAPTLEWTTSSPPPADNFDRPPVVAHAAHEPGLPAQLGSGEAPAATAATDGEVGALFALGSIGVIAAGLLFSWGALPDPLGWDAAADLTGPIHLAAAPLLAIAAALARRLPGALLAVAGAACTGTALVGLAVDFHPRVGTGLALVGLATATATALVGAAAARFGGRRTARLLCAGAAAVAALVSLLLVTG